MRPTTTTLLAALLAYAVAVAGTAALFVLDHDPAGELARVGAVCVVAAAVSATLWLHHRAVRAARESRDRFERVFRAVPVAMALSKRDSDGRFTWVDVNDAFCALTGWSRRELLGKSSEQIGFVDAEVVRGLRREAAAGPMRNRRIRARTRAGEERTALFSSEPMVVAGETVYATMTVDVTDTIRAAENEEKLRVAEARFTEITDGMRDVFWLARPDFAGIDYVSPSYEAVWGRPRGELYRDPRAWLDAVHPDDRAAAALSNGAFARGEGDFLAEYRVVRPDGTVRFVRDRGYAVRNERGEIVRLAGFAADITGEKKLEEELRQTQKLESVGRLAGGVAHDFNNVLTVISSSLDFLDAAVAGEDHEVVDDIRKATTRAASLTRQLLAFSRRQVIEPRVVDVNALVVDTLKMIRRVVGEDIAVTTELAADAGTIRVDPGQLVQVLMNLAVNARDAMPAGGSLAFHTRRGRDGLVLDVADTGCGMSEQVKSRIFEPFFTTKPAGVGTGLGLAVTHGIVAQSGGTIDVDSAPGKGTVFHLCFPTVDAAADDEALENTPVPAGHETVLVVEDDEAVRKIAARSLRRRGFRVLTASHGAEALAILVRERSVDALVTDVVMPGVGGRELADRARGAIPGLAVLYVTGYTDDEVLRRGVGHGDVELLQKPYSPDELAARVRAVLDAPRAA